MPTTGLRAWMLPGLALLLCATSFTAIAQQGPGPVPGLGPGPGPGGAPQPLANLTVAERQAFAEGARVFARRYTVAEGLGPVFNDDSCAGCHRGGGGPRRVTRIGRVADGRFDDLAALGGSLLQARGIGAVPTAEGTWEFLGETVPDDATIVVPRRSQPLFGLGLVDAVPDATLQAIADEQAAADPGTAGRVARFFDPAAGGEVVGRFGWKAQVPSLRAFSGDALLNELGITSPGFRDEVCPQGNCAALAFNPAPALNDDGRDAAAIADFMTMLAPPARGPVTEAVLRGEEVFHALGCATCHRPSLTTGDHPVRALARVTFQPYSDFLLHDMGRLGDGVAQGAAGAAEMRTAPLWGLANETRFLHDGSADSVEEAITRHAGQAREARQRFTALATDARDALLAFLGSL